MIHEEAWPKGTPAWCDLIVPDRVAAQRFYGSLFGWEYEVGAPETGSYTTALKHGQRVAGIGEPLEGASPPATWTTYLAVDDAAATVKAATGAGATVLTEPLGLAELGTMALFADPTGAVVGVWQSGVQTGANLVNEPGAMIWAEGVTNDLAAARAFYGTVFGYTFDDMSGDGWEYASFNVEGKSVGGIGGKGTGPEGGAPHWRVYFGVADTDEAVERAVELGATLLSGPSDSPYGRIAMLAGPFGEQFTLMSTENPESPDPNPNPATSER